MHRFVTLILILIAAWVRIATLSEDVRFHGDEALFATYARGAAVTGDWMLTGPLDKPPVSLYVMALSMQFTGVTTLPDGVLTLDAARGEWSARLPGVLAGIVTVALVMAAAHRLAGQRAAWFAGVLAALSPQLVAFSATAFTDPVLLVFLVASLAAAISGRTAWSGVWLAVAFATKQQAVLYLPLALLLMLIHGRELPWRPALMRFLVAFAIGVGLLLLWDALRPGLSIFETAADNNNPYRFVVPPVEWPLRVQLIGVYLSTMFGAWPVTAAVVLCAVAGAVLALLPRTRPGIHRAERGVIGTLSLFTLLYLLVHVVLPFNIYDRYFLFVVPPLILLVAWTLARVVPRALTVPALVVLGLLALTTPARFPTDVRDRNPELIALADFINAQGIGTIVYNRWLGWEMGYYLGPWSDKRVVFYPTPELFADDAPCNPDDAPRLFIAPSWASTGPWLGAAESAGFAVRIAYRSGDYAAWWLTPVHRD